MSKKALLFTIEPYVHISIKKNNVLLYNSLTGKIIEYKNEPTIVHFIKKVKSNRNLLFLSLTEDFLEANPRVTGFIRLARKYFFGDLFDLDYPGEKPVQLMPILNVQRDIKKMKTTPEWSYGETIKTYLSELTLYINSECGNDCSMCHDGYKQHLICHREESVESQTELPLEAVVEFLNEAKGSYLNKINISGGNIARYTKFRGLIRFLKNIPVQKDYFIHYRNVRDSDEFMGDLKDALSLLRIIVDFPVDRISLSNAIRATYTLNSSFIFVLQNFKEFEEAQNIIEIMDICDYHYQPYFNQNNLSFFKKFVFVKKKDILDSKPTMKEIFTRMAINKLCFGNLTVLWNGDIHAGIVEHRLGVLGKNSLFDLLSREISIGRSWRRTRGDVFPCKNCTFEYLCPPLSNYEYVIGKNNLCHIWREN